MPEDVREQLILLGNTAIIVTSTFVKVVPAGPPNCKNSFRQTSGGKFIGGQLPECEGLDMESRIKVPCVCGKVGLVERKHIGKTITCPKCGIARIRIEDPEACLPKDDESGTIEIIDGPPTNKKTEIPRVPPIVQGKPWAIRRHWQLTAICCLLAIIAGIMSYNQYDGWRRDKKAKESAEWKRRGDLFVETYVRRTGNDNSFDEACGGVPVVDVSAGEFLDFVAEQPDDSRFSRSFETRMVDRSDYGGKRFSSYEISDMPVDGDLFLRWAILKGGVDEAELAKVGRIHLGMKTIRFTRDDECLYAFRFGVNIGDLFSSEFWFSDDPANETFGSFRNKNRNWLLGGEDYLLYRIDAWKRADKRGDWNEQK